MTPISSLPAYGLIGLLLALGAIVGSFLNVVVMRYIKKEEIIIKRSYCPECKKTLAWYDLIPIFSYIFLRGQCRMCHKKISPQYPMIEGVAAIAAVALFFGPHYISTLSSSILFIAVCVLLVLAVIDWRTMLLPDKFIIALTAIAITYTLANPAFLWQQALGGALIGAGFLGLVWFMTKGQGLGLGDVKLMVPTGILLGIPATITALFLAFIIGGGWGAYLLLTKKASPKTAVPFGPLLAGAAIACLLFPALTIQFFATLGWPIP